MMQWLGQAIRDYVIAYGWVATLITFVVIAGVAWLFRAEITWLIQWLFFGASGQTGYLGAPP